VLVTTAYDVFRRPAGGPTVCALQDGDERAQAQQLLPLIAPNSLSLFDRGFPSTASSMTSTSTLASLSCVVQRPPPSCRRGLCAQWAGRNPPLLTPSDTFSARSPQPSVGLLPRFASAHGWKLPWHVSVLLTNLVDLRPLSPRAIIALYWRRGRWKPTTGPRKPCSIIEQFHSHTPHGILRNSSPS